MSEPVHSLHSDVLGVLGERIAWGEYPPGEVLTLAGLGQELGVSRTVVREVVRVLESLGMVVSRRRVGITVRPVTSWQVLDRRVIGWRLTGPDRDRQLFSLTELRMAVEPTAARLAASRAPAPEAQQLVDLAQIMRELGEAGRGRDEAYLRADVDYHAMMLRLSGNEMLLALADAVEAVLVGRHELGLTPSRPAQQAMVHHEAAAQAVVAGDQETAEHHARAMVTTVSREVDAQSQEG